MGRTETASARNAGIPPREKTRWLLERGDVPSAAAELRTVLTQRPDWDEALAVSAMLAAHGSKI